MCPSSHSFVYTFFIQVARINFNEGFSMIKFPNCLAEAYEETFGLCQISA